jgi:hypothetical protein
MGACSKPNAAKPSIGLPSFGIQNQETDESEPVHRANRSLFPGLRWPSTIRARKLPRIPFLKRSVCGPDDQRRTKTRPKNADNNVKIRRERYLISEKSRGDALVHTPKSRIQSGHTLGTGFSAAQLRGQRFDAQYRSATARF